MGDKREDIKKSLGISEYPWSSDDEDISSSVRVRPQVPDQVFLWEPGSSSQPQPSTSAAADIPTTSQQVVRKPSCPKQERRDVLCSLNYHHEKGKASWLESLTRLRYRENKRRETFAGLNKISPELREILAMKKAVRTIHLNQRDRIYKHFNSPIGARQGLSSINPLFTPRMPSTVDASFSAGRSKPSQSASVKWERDSDHEIPNVNRSINDQPSTSSGFRRHYNPEINLNSTVDISSVDDIDGEDQSQSNTRAENEQNEQSAVITVPDSPRVEISLEEEVLEVEPVQGIEENSESVAVQPEGFQAAEGEAANSERSESRSLKRKRAAKEDAYKELNQTLLRLLECPVCLEWLGAPMWQCRRGHLVCAGCRARLHACPVCRMPFSSVRNRGMEAVADSVRYPCRYGCGRAVRRAERATHEPSCARRRYPCAAPNCRELLLRVALGPHVQSKHPSIIKFGRKHDLLIKVNSEQHETWVIMALREVFNLRIDVDERTRSVTVYVVYMGPKNNAKQYSYEVEVLGKHNSRKLLYSRSVHSDIECATVNVSRQDCFHLSLDQALNFLRIKNRHCETDNALNISVSLSSSGSDVNDDDDS